METIQTVLLRKDCGLGLDTQNRTLMAFIHGKCEVFYITLTFKETQLIWLNFILAVHEVMYTNIYRTSASAWVAFSWV